MICFGRHKLNIAFLKILLIVLCKSLVTGNSTYVLEESKKGIAQVAHSNVKILSKIVFTEFIIKLS